MEFISAKAAAAGWGLGLRRVQDYCKSGRVPGAKKQGNTWLIPLGSPKPADPRKARKDPAAVHHGYMMYAFAPWPRNDPMSLLPSLSEPLRSLTKANFSTYKGDYAPAKKCWHNISPADPHMPTAALAACAAAISSGDYALYHEIQDVLKGCISETQDESLRALLSLPEVLTAVNLSLPAMAPEWLKNCDFSLFPADLRPFLLYLYALHLRNMGDPYSARAVARTTLALIENPHTFTWMEIYLRLLCSGAAYYLGELDEARHALNDALSLAAPFGLYAPYAEWLTGFGGMLETALAQQYPHLLKPATTLWRQVSANWTNFRNQFTHENITTILNPQEYHAALLYARGMTSRQVAGILSLSESRIRAILSEIYQKLNISGKNELKSYLITY